MPDRRETPGDVTLLLQKARGGDDAALDQVLPLIYGELPWDSDGYNLL